LKDKGCNRFQICPYMLKMGQNDPKCYMLWLQNCFGGGILIPVNKGKQSGYSNISVDNSGIAV